MARLTALVALVLPMMRVPALNTPDRDAVPTAIPSMRSVYTVGSADASADKVRCCHSLGSSATVAVMTALAVVDRFVMVTVGIMFAESAVTIDSPLSSMRANEPRLVLVGLRYIPRVNDALRTV